MLLPSLTPTRPLEGKTVAITGASGTLGRALLRRLQQRRAIPLALSTSTPQELEPGVKTLQWQPGHETDLAEALTAVDILVINHGWNSHRDRSATAIQKSLDANALSGWRLVEVFLTTVTATAPHKEIWVNTSEAEVSPALSPLYEISKRLMGELVTLKRLDAPCPIRKLILGPFKSKLNPVGVMSADWVAGAIVALAERDARDIIVTVNPLTYMTFPLKEATHRAYCSLFSQPDDGPSSPASPMP